MDLIAQLLDLDLRRFLEEEGQVFDGENTLCPFHDDHVPSLHVTKKPDAWLWFCHGCKQGGNIITWVMKKHDLTKHGAVKWLAEKFNLSDGKPELIASYPYQNETGQELFKMLRFKPKSFKADRKMTGIRQVPYHLPEVLAADEVWLVEGEKDADNVRAQGLTATTSPFGVSHWRSSFSEFFKEKSVNICLDCGYRTEAESRARDIARFAREVRIVELPGLKKDEDITDWIERHDAQGTEDIAGELCSIAAEAPVFDAKPSSGPAVRNKFLRQYVESAQQVTDAPMVFLLFSGIGLLSAINNKFYFHYPRKTPLNLYLLLLAPSTFYRKSVTIDIGNDYLEAVNPDLCFPESFTSEALLEILTKRSRGLLSWRELIQVKEFQFGSDYNRGLPSLLTDLYDFKPVVRRWTKGEGETRIENPTISILAAGISTWLVENLKKVDFLGGIWTRFLFIPAPEEDDRKYRTPSRFNLDPEIERQLRNLNDRPGEEMNLDKIMPLIYRWGESHQHQAQALRNPILQAGFMRLEVMLIKIACLLQLAQDGSIIVEPESFEEAVRYIEWVKSVLPKFFEEEVVFSIDDRDRASVVKTLRKRGATDRSTLLRDTHLRRDRFDKAITQLLDEERVKFYQERQHEGAGRPKTTYELNE